MVWATARFEEFVQWLVGDSEGGPRPTSVEVEIPAEEGESAEDVEAELPEATRQLLQHAVELTRMDVSEMMKPASAIVSLPSTVSAQTAAETFRKTGRSRIPLFGANRDDIVGILLAKDLWDKMLSSTDPNSVVPVRIVRPALYVPETSSAFDLIGQLRGQRSQMAIVLDEYGAVAGLVTLEDLLEQLVGSIDDEHDEPTAVDLVKQVGENRYEVDASVMIEDLNDRFDLDLPTDEDYETIGGMALHVLGRLPEIGASFRKDGIEFKVLDVRDQSIRRLSLALSRANADSNR
jgi:CBS domain containing-hemolysin-like protein